MKRVMLSVALALSLAATEAVACAWGPMFPQSYVAGDETGVLLMPGGDFYRELAAIAAAEGRPLAAHDPQDDATEQPADLYWKRTLAADQKDLDEALTQAGMAAANRRALVAEYVALRQAMKLAADGSTADPNHDAKNRAAPGRFDLAPHEALLKKLPAEFALYVRGAAAYKTGEAKAAVGHWKAVLALPPAARRYRSTWAAFMIGKAALSGDPTTARTWFEKTRTLAAEGLADSLRLADASLGWQGRAELDLGLYDQALAHYYQLFRTARFPESIEGCISLDRTCYKALTDKKARLDVLAADPLCHRILTAWVLSSPSMGDSPELYHAQSCAAWLDAVEVAAKRSPKGVAAGADRLAWAAYRAGRMEAAARWAALADPKAPYARWVRSKLLLRAGKIDEALEVLRGLVGAFPAEEAWEEDHCRIVPDETVRTEVGLLLLGRRDYTAALDMLVRGMSWDDAAYVAERVLTVDELTDFIAKRDKDAALTALPPKRNPWETQQPSAISRLRYVLARRLARQGDWTKARPLWPAQTLPHADRYVAIMAIARDAKRADRDRAVALYRAARLVRTYGLALLGTELDPDWGVYGGNNDGNTLARRGVAQAGERDFDHDFVPITGPAALLAALGPTGDERARVTRSAPTPNTRFHYRTTAAELMWQCGERLPDNDPLLARALWEGGVYLKDRDPKAADRFYKALVNRCRKLPIGQEADRLRWFPKEPPPLPEGVE